MFACQAPRGHRSAKLAHMTVEPRTATSDLVAAGVYDPNAPDAPERLALLEYLVGLGATVDDLRSVPPGELPLLAASLALFDGRERYTLDEVASLSGLSPDLLSRAWRAAGLPEPPAGTPAMSAADVQLFTTLAASVELFGVEPVLQLVRVLGSAAARVADAAISSFTVNVGADALNRDPSGLELARLNAEAASLIPGVVQGFDALLRHQIELLRRPIDAMTVVPGAGVEVRAASVGFVDLVGSTALANSLEPRELAQALELFDATSSDVVTSYGGRVVKLLGDEAMFVADDPSAAVSAALALVDTFATHDVLPPVHGAVATGTVVARDGDYSGAVVNLAARAASIARPSAILVDAPTRDALAPRAFATTSAGPHKLKGFPSRIRLYRVRRSELP